MCRQHSQGEILTNYEYYERIFKESATAPPVLNAKTNGDISMTYNAIAEAALEPRVENPHFSLPETFHNAMSFRSYDNHGFGKSISSLLDTFSENDHTNTSIKDQFSDMVFRTSRMERVGFLRNTPPDFPMIVHEAMQKQGGGSSGPATAGISGASRKINRKIPRQNAVQYVVEDEAGGGSGGSQAGRSEAGRDAEDIYNQFQDDMDRHKDALPPPPDTPLIERDCYMDFSSAVNKNLAKSKTQSEDDLTATYTAVVNDNDNDMVLETPSSDINLNLENVFNKNKVNINRSGDSIKKWPENSFVNNIDAMQLDDDDDMGLAHCLDNMHIDDADDVLGGNTKRNDINSNLDAKGKSEIVDDDDVFREYNSHQYWYISPDLPVDTDILLDPEEKSKCSFIFGIILTKLFCYLRLFSLFCHFYRIANAISRRARLTAFRSCQTTTKLSIPNSSRRSYQIFCIIGPFAGQYCCQLFLCISFSGCCINIGPPKLVGDVWFVASTL